LDFFIRQFNKKYNDRDIKNRFTLYTSVICVIDQIGDKTAKKRGTTKAIIGLLILLRIKLSIKTDKVPLITLNKFVAKKGLFMKVFNKYPQKM
jgi:hypothetical protein